MNHNLSRRSFLTSTATIILSQLLLGCSNTSGIPQILLLEDSIPAQLIGDFRKTLARGEKIDFKPNTQLRQIFTSLLNWQQSKKSDKKNNSLLDKIFKKSVDYPNLTTLGDSWLQSAIQENLIQPLLVDDLNGWQKLPFPWQKLVQRNDQGELAIDGKIWGAPYRWGSTVIAYRSDKLAKLNLIPQDWDDLWRPELGDRISLLDAPREVIGFTLKKLGYSYNIDNLDQISNLESELLALHKQAKLYSSDNYLQPLILGDTWMAVAWSGDVLPLMKRYSNIKFFIPKSGTSLWADIWVKPQLAKTPAKETDIENISTLITKKWINFCWQSKAAQQISLFTNGTSPIFLGTSPENLPKNLKNDVFLTSKVLNSDKSEFLLPLSKETAKQYESLWVKTRQVIND